MRENGEVAAATYLVQHSAEAACFLELWDLLGHASHRNQRPMLNTDNGVLLLLVARLVHEHTARACEALALQTTGVSGHWGPTSPVGSGGVRGVPTSQGSGGSQGVPTQRGVPLLMGKLRGSWVMGPL